MPAKQSNRILFVQRYDGGCSKLCALGTTARNSPRDTDAATAYTCQRGDAVEWRCEAQWRPRRPWGSGEKARLDAGG